MKKTTITTPLDLMEAARLACDPPTWYRLSKEIGTTPQDISRWRARDGAYDDEAACELARILGMDLEQVIAIREAHRATGEEKRARWRARLTRYAVWLIASASYLFANDERSVISQAQAYSENSRATTTPNNMLKLTRVQIMRLSRRIRQWLKSTRRTFALAPQLTW
jgi:hypothetical protein